MKDFLWLRRNGNQLYYFGESKGYSWGREGGFYVKKEVTGES